MKRIRIRFFVGKAVDGPVVQPVRVTVRQHRTHRWRRFMTTVNSNP
jgi:hypothetical protein